MAQQLTEKEMLLKLIDCVEKVNEAKQKYEMHPGGGASQKIKNKLAKECQLRNIELANAVFNIKQLLK